MTVGITAVILTMDEAVHIERCIRSIQPIVERIVVVDSGSADETCALAKAAGAEVFFNQWRNHADQFNWALDNTEIKTKWTLRIDADEVITEDLAHKIESFLPSILDESKIAAITINRSIHFLGRRLRWGGLYPRRMLRLWQTGKGRLESRWMDEHVIVTGPIIHIDGEIADINLKSVGWWTAKHNGYATREAIDQLTKSSASSNPAALLSPQARRTRWMKDNIYARLPLGLRPLLYFLYRYIFRFGFLDGWQGLAFHGLQGLWYRFLVDVKIAEIRSLMKARNQDLATVIEAEYGHKL